MKKQKTTRLGVCPTDFPLVQAVNEKRRDTCPVHPHICVLRLASQILTFRRCFVCHKFPGHLWISAFTPEGLSVFANVFLYCTFFFCTVLSLHIHRSMGQHACIKKLSPFFVTNDSGIPLELPVCCLRDLIRCTWQLVSNTLTTLGT